MQIDESYSNIFIEIGDRNHFSELAVIVAAAAFRKAVNLHPNARISLAIGGYDDDPRELWEIAEARDFLRRFAIAAGMADGRGTNVEHLDSESVSLLSISGAFGAGPFDVMRKSFGG